MIILRKASIEEWHVTRDQKKLLSMLPAERVQYIKVEGEAKGILAVASDEKEYLVRVKEVSNE